MNVFRKNQEITLSAPLTDPASCRMILFRSAKIERSGFLHSAEFFEICKKSLRSILHSGFMNMQKIAALYFCTPDL